jgi:hypothetical protein
MQTDAAINIKPRRVMDMIFKDDLMEKAERLCHIF